MAGAEKKVQALELKRQGIHLMQARDYAGAVAKFDAALELWPDNREIQILRDMFFKKNRAHLLQLQVITRVHGPPSLSRHLLQRREDRV